MIFSRKYFLVPSFRHPGYFLRKYYPGPADRNRRYLNKIILGIFSRKLWTCLGEILRGFARNRGFQESKIAYF